MSLLSRLFGRSEPPAPLPAAPQPLARSYDAATGAARRGSFGTFGSINSEIAAAGHTVTSRARHSIENNAWIANAVQNYATALVGTGITAAPRHPDATTRAALVETWRRWTDHADADGRTDFEGLQAIIARTLIVDGEALAQRLLTPQGWRIRVLPTDLLDRSLTHEIADGRYIEAGVEFNADGARVAYHLLERLPDSAFASYGKTIRVPASSILHVMRPSAPGQVRGISWLAPALLAANELDQLQDALLVGVKTAAMFAGFVTNPNEIGTPADLFEADHLAGGITPGAIKVLPGGLDVKFTSPQQANQTDAFVKLNLRQLAAAIGVPVHMLDGDLTGANYSSLRAGLLPFRAKVESIQYGTIVPQLLNPIWGGVVEYAVIHDQLTAPDYESQSHLYAADWLPPRPLQVDPLKDIQATVAELEAGLTSRRKAAAERGWSLEDLDAEIQAEKVE